jgi:hypothetical protein
MFEFIYKMFGEGDAAIPKAGIEAIPKQLLQNLRDTTFQYNTKVASIKEGKITLVDGTYLSSDFTLVATEASSLIANLSNQVTEWKSCTTLYFETEGRIIREKLIGLISAKGTLVNSIFYPTCLETITKSNKELLSVTVVNRQNLTDELLLEKVKSELSAYCGIASCDFIKLYTIPMALPKLKDLKYEMLPSETRLTTTVFLAGGTQLNGSLNAAMISGERAALGIIEAASN